MFRGIRMIRFFHDMHANIFYNICGTYRRLERNVFLCYCEMVEDGKISSFSFFFSYPML